MSGRWYYKGHHGLIKLQLNHLKEYVETLENLIGKELSDFDSFVEKEAAKLEEEERDFFYDHHLDTQWQLSEIFPNILRTSLFIKCYSILETELINMCDVLQKRNNYPIRLSDLKGKGIFLAQLYYKKVVGIEFPDQSKSWAEILKYNLIRNIFVHKEGHLSDDDKSKKAADYIENKTSILLDKYCRIQLTKDFVPQAIDVIEDFFNEFFEVIEKNVKSASILL